MHGQPIGLLAKDGTVFILMDEEHNPRRDGLTNFRKAAIENMANVVTVHGTFSEVAGQKALYVQGYVRGAVTASPSRRRPAARARADDRAERSSRPHPGGVGGERPRPLGCVPIEGPMSKGTESR